MGTLHQPFSFEQVPAFRPALSGFLRDLLISVSHVMVNHKRGHVPEPSIVPFISAPPLVRTWILGSYLKSLFVPFIFASFVFCGFERCFELFFGFSRRPGCDLDLNAICSNWFGLVKCELFRRAPSLRWVQVGPLNPLLEMSEKSGDQFVAQKRAKSAQKRTKKRNNAQIQFRVLIGTQDSLGVAIFVRSRTNTTVTGLYISARNQLGRLPQSCQTTLYHSSGPSLVLFFHKRTFFQNVLEIWVRTWFFRT